MYKTSCCLTSERVIAAEKLELQSHHQLQDVLDVGLATEAHVHTCIWTCNKVIISCQNAHMNICLCYQANVKLVLQLMMAL